MSPHQAQSQGGSSSNPPAAGPVTPPAAAVSLFGSYAPPLPELDEYVRHSRIQPELWEPFVDRLDKLGPTGLATAWKRGEDLLREHGIAYNLMADQPQSERLWNLDPIPLIISEEEWETLSRGVIQRARLWNTILHDLYGSQELLRSGLLPSSAVFAQPNFNRSLRYLPDRSRPLLSLYAVDVSRAPDGSWTVVADRTEAPNGTGFALENRIVLTNVFPETSKKLHLLRLASYFQALRSTLIAQAPAAIDTPRVVLLSPGPGDRTYFEDAYLTRYLGITLAVGEELTVRGDRLYLKTVSGLQRVHVLLRRVSETSADPLEIPTKSHLGVPGLMQVVRAGAVAVVNPPGTGITEAPAFLPFLPAIAESILGQDLLLPSVETAWSGHTPDLAEKLDANASVVKSAFARNLFPPAITRTLSPDQLAALRKEIAENPGRHVVQREVQFSTAPSWNGTSLEPRAIALRLFLFADGDSYRVMPGGLVRCASRPDSLPGLSLREHTSSKDLWVLSSKERPAVTPTNLPDHQPLRRASGNLSSRSADNMLWIGRYSERAEYATRILLEIVQCATAEQDTLDLPPLAPLLRTLANLDYLDASTLDLKALTADRTLLLKTLQPLFYGDAPPRSKRLDSIPANLSRLRSLAAVSRDRLSNESWRIIQNLENLVRGQLPMILSTFRPALQGAILLQSAFNGTCRENLTRSEGWRFLNLGRKLERSLWLLTLTDEILALYPELPSSVLDAALSVTDCTLTYRFRYQGAPSVLPALDLLLYDPAVPRGLAYQMADLDHDFANLPAPPPDQILRPAHRTILRARHHLQTELLPVEDAAGEATTIAALHSFVSNLREAIPEVAEQLGWEFFTHASFTAS